MEAIESQSQSQEQDSHVMSEDAEDVGKNTNRISYLEKEAVSLWEQILDLTEKNGLLEAEKAKVADINLVISESNGKIETMGKVIEGLTEQVSTAEDEIAKLKEELFTKVILHTELTSTVKSMEQTTDLSNERFKLQQAKETDLQAQISLGLSEIAKRDAQITELNAHIDQLKVSHKAEEDRWYTDTERLKTQLRENHERKVLALNQKIQQLKDDNAILEAEKANRPELINQRKKIEIMGGLIKTLRKQLSTADGENLKLKRTLSDKELKINQSLYVGNTLDSVKEELDSKEAWYQEMDDRLNSFGTEISQRDDIITELKSKINLLKASHAGEKDRWSADMEILKMEIREKCELIEDLKFLLSETETESGGTGKSGGSDIEREDGSDKTGDLISRAVAE